MQRVYCFVDESGQDTLGKSFYIAVVIINNEFVEIVRSNLQMIEGLTGKGSSKWRKGNVNIRKEYLLKARELIRSKGKVYFSVFHNTKEYVSLTSVTLIQAISYYSDITEIEASIIIDGLNEREADKVLRLLKAIHIRYKKIRGMKDESEPILRFADSIAWLVRDADEGQEYAKDLVTGFKKKGVLFETKK
jgi:hypothetical protein